MSIYNHVMHNNKFDYYLIFFISLQIFGMIGGSLQPIRIFTIVFSPFMILYLIKHRKDAMHYQYELFVFVFWILYALFSLLWVKDLVLAVKAINYLLINFMSVLMFFYFAIRATNPILSIIRGWVIFILLSLPIAFYEIFFDGHLSIASQKAGSIIGGTSVFLKFASVTFGNYNSYNVRLVYALPFIFSLLFFVRKRVMKILILALILSVFFILMTNGSRGALLCIVMIAISFMFYAVQSALKKIGLICLLIILTNALFFYFDDLFFLLFYRLKNIGFHDNTRLELIKKSLTLLGDSYLFGVGSGNFQVNMSSKFFLKIYAAHNLFLEVLVSFGVIVFIFFMGLILRIIKFIKSNHSKVSRYIVVTSLIVFPVVSIIDSGYLLGISFWLHLASLYIIADRRYFN